MGNLYLSGSSGAALTTATFKLLFPGNMGGLIIAISLVFFGFSTILGWAYYGEKCATYAFGIKYLNHFRPLYMLSVMLGALIHLDLVWAMADIFNGLMAIPNLIALLLLSGVVVSETKDFIAKRKRGELP